jgi:hypothetical protein
VTRQAVRTLRLTEACFPLHRLVEHASRSRKLLSPEVGRNARRRAHEREEKRPHGLTPEEEESGEGQGRCPRCGSTQLVTMQRPLGLPPAAPGGDVVCVHCGWQGKLAPTYWG